MEVDYNIGNLELFSGKVIILINHLYKDFQENLLFWKIHIYEPTE
jgi:hypothetical protein